MDPWIIQAWQQQVYIEQFQALHPINGILIRDQVNEFLQEKQLSTAARDRIWQLADRDADSNMNQIEFMIACKLTYLTLLPEVIPEVLPVALVQSLPKTEESWMSNLIFGGLTVAAAAAGAYALYQNCGSSNSNASPEKTGSSNHLQHSIMDSLREGASNLWNMTSFWKKVQHSEEDDTPFVEVEALVENQARKYRHPYNKFDPRLMELHANIIRIQRAEHKLYKAALGEVIQILHREMCRDLPYDVVFRDLRPAGSAWEDLRICCPDEFDLNTVLMPLDMGKSNGVKVVDKKGGHIALQISLQDFPDEYRSILRKWLDEDGYLNRDKVLEWMQSVVDKALRRVKDLSKWGKVKDVVRSRSGPAITLTVFLQDGKKFSIDFVPALEFSISLLPPKMQKKVRNVSLANRNWCAIPKGPTRDADANIWRTSMYEIERDVMRGQEHLKPTIRLIKRLRDVQDWKFLSSYYIKTVFMSMKEETGYKNYGLGEYMMHALNALTNALDKGQILYYWDDDHNLLQPRLQRSITNYQLYQNTANRLRSIVARFDRSLNDDSVDPMKNFFY